MHIPKTIINRLIPFFSKDLSNPSLTILKKAKATLDRQASKGYLEVVSNINWARIITNKLDDVDFFEEPIWFVIKRDSLEEIGYRDSLQEAAPTKVESKKEKVESFDSLLPTFYFLLLT